MQHLRANLRRLQASRPDLAAQISALGPGNSGVELLHARNGAVTLKLDARPEASLEDPLAEGRELAAHFVERARACGAQRLVVFGLGVHTLPALCEFAGSILVIEPSLAVCRAVFEHVELGEAVDRVEWAIGEEAAAALSHPLFRSRERGVFVAHGAARRRAAELHDRLAARFHPGGVASTLDIAVVPPLYGGSLPVAQACARALRQLGHRVRELDLEPFLPAFQEIQRLTADDRLSAAGDRLRAGLSRVIGETILAGFELDPPDLVFALAQAPLDAATLDRCGQLGITRAFWFCEDFHVMSYWRGLTHCYDTIFHVQPDAFSEPLRAAGGHGAYLPMGFDPELHRPVQLTPEQQARYGCELSFLGAGYHNRVQMLQPLFSAGLRIYGTEWPTTPPFMRVMPEPNQRQSSVASNQIFNASKINLNLHSSPWCDGVNPAGDYLNPRTFELAGARCFQLVDERSDLSLAFEPGVEIETFRDVEECRHKIRYFLDHPDERQEIAARAQSRALAEHTYRHRMEAAIATLAAGPLPLVPRRRTLPTAGSIAKGVEPALAQVLSRIHPERVLDSDAITAAIQGGEGPLSREEKLLLFMREARGEVRVVETRA